MAEKDDYAEPGQRPTEGWPASVKLAFALAVLVANALLIWYILTPPIKYNY